MIRFTNRFIKSAWSLWSSCRSPGFGRWPLSAPHRGFARVHACARDALPPPSFSLWDNDKIWSGSVAYTGNYDSEYTGEVSQVGITLQRDATMVVVLHVTRAQTAPTSGYRFGKYRKYGAVAAHCAV